MERRILPARSSSKFLGKVKRPKPDKEGDKDDRRHSTFSELVSAYKQSDIATDQQKAASLAQWIIESGRGTSKLAIEHCNYGGLKWRPEMAGYATPVDYVASDGPSKYCEFKDLEAFIRGYWKFISRSPYRGHERFKDDAEGYIRFVGKIYATDPGYVQKVLAVLPEAAKLLGVEVDIPKKRYDKPPVTWRPSQKYSSRNGTKINLIVMHYTAGPTAEGAIDTLTKPVSRGGRKASAHYIVGKDGKIYQLVSEQNKAWHAPNVNLRSIGIEHVAMPGDRLTGEQEKATVELCKYLLYKYGMDYTQITGHKFTGQATQCPANLFGPNATASELVNWRRKHFSGEFG